jgi:hypothetical protein
VIPWLSVRRFLEAVNEALENAMQLLAYRLVHVVAQIAAELYRHVLCSEPAGILAEHFTYQAFSAVPVDCPRRALPACDDAETGMSFSIADAAQDEVLAGASMPGPQHPFEIAALAQHLRGACYPPLASFIARALRASRQTASRALPFALRALMTARPALVFIRTRKPCVRLRRVLEG